MEKECERENKNNNNKEQYQQQQPQHKANSNTGCLAWHVYTFFHLFPRSFVVLKILLVILLSFFFSFYSPACDAVQISFVMFLMLLRLEAPYAWLSCCFNCSAAIVQWIHHLFFLCVRVLFFLLLLLRVCRCSLFALFISYFLPNFFFLVFLSCSSGFFSLP